MKTILTILAVVSTLVFASTTHAHRQSPPPPPPPLAPGPVLAIVGGDIIIKDASGAVWMCSTMTNECSKTEVNVDK